MNPILRGYLDRIDGLLSRVEERAAERQRLLEFARAQRDDLRAKYWTRTKELHVASEGVEAFEALQQENEALRNAHAAADQGLRRVLGQVKSLREEFRP